MSNREFKKDYFGRGNTNELYFPEGEDAGYCISFNARPCAGYVGWENSLGLPETAFIINNPDLRVGGEGQYNIVDVDAREKYLQCSTIEECRAVFEALRKEYGNGEWSDYFDSKLDR